VGQLLGCRTVGHPRRQVPHPGMVPTAPDGRGLSCLRLPPSTSGPGHSPFKAVARVRIPPGAFPSNIRSPAARMTMFDGARTHAALVGRSRTGRLRRRKTFAVAERLVTHKIGARLVAGSQSET